jgi:hypothetical protein
MKKQAKIQRQRKLAKSCGEAMLEIHVNAMPGRTWKSAEGGSENDMIPKIQGGPSPGKPRV